MTTFYIAKITNNNDPDKEGKVQIEINSLMHGFKTSEYPWARPSPLSTGGSDSSGTSCIPEKDSLVWVFFENEAYHKNPYFFGDVHLKNFHPHNIFEDKIKSNIVGWMSSYPDVKFIVFPNDVCIAISSNLTTPEIAISHPAASIFITALGEIKMKGIAENVLDITAAGINLNNNLIITK